MCIYIYIYTYHIIHIYIYHIYTYINIVYRLCTLISIHVYILYTHNVLNISFATACQDCKIEQLMVDLKPIGLFLEIVSTPPDGAVTTRQTLELLGLFCNRDLQELQHTATHCAVLQHSATQTATYCALVQFELATHIFT